MLLEVLREGRVRQSREESAQISCLSAAITNSRNPSNPIFLHHFNPKVSSKYSTTFLYFWKTLNIETENCCRHELKKLNICCIWWTEKGSPSANHFQNWGICTDRSISSVSCGLSNQIGQFRMNHVPTVLTFVTLLPRPCRESFATFATFWPSPFLHNVTLVT